MHLLQATGYRKLLTDQRLRATATEECIGWLLSDWLTQVGSNRLLTHAAVVAALPLDLRLQAVDVCTKGRRRYGIKSQFFATPEQARQWLEKPSAVETAP
ncbi:hypothetical protein DNI29_23305 [Hymenobacter sediminis]|uniref:hypothetical protein n=1 Tax=Hymenobacter sediminis TaxID=2218621 RepID=UPI000DA6459F|nr:hypothetical protein [Hymenobacter sediminis]RPD43667.1 hypothetical protein DNI29_23305 [Hymenobacter sediminis]